MLLLTWMWEIVDELHMGCEWVTTLYTHLFIYMYIYIYMHINYTPIYIYIYMCHSHTVDEVAHV